MADHSTSTSHLPKERKEDTRQCRICLAGVEEEAELGRLIKPCHCKGSIRYVHVKCIETWRKTGSSINSSSYWRCGQCGASYRLARTKILGLSTSPWVLGPTTVALFLMIVFAASALVSWFAPDLSDPNIAPLPLEPDYGLVWWQSPLGVASEVIRETVHAFAEVSTPRDVIEAQRMETLRDIEDTTAWGRFKRRIPLIPKEKKVKKRIVRRRDPRSPYSPTEDGPQAGFWARLIRKFMLGLSLVGILSFLNILFTVGLFGPLQIARARWIRGGGRREASVRDAGTILIIIFVSIGVARALYGVYKMTQSMAQRLLIRAENAILEVQDDDEEEEEQCPQPDRAEEASTQEKATSTSRGQRPTRLDNLRARRPDEDDFGNELPDTPGGWREEWHI